MFPPLPARPAPSAPPHPAAHRIDRKPHIGHLPDSTLGCGVGTKLQMAVALGIHRRAVGIGQRQAAHARLLQRQHFAGIGKAVAVRSLPDPKA